MKISIFFFLVLPLFAIAQKKPLDHSVYDGWQNVGEHIISNNGKWVVYTVTPQEGDADLFVQAAVSGLKDKIERGYNAVITEDSKFVIFKIKPLWKQTREAKIKKKKPEDFPKDSIGIFDLEKQSIWKSPGVRTFKTPDKASGWLAYHKERETNNTKNANVPTQKTVDSLQHKVDSLVLLVRQIKNMKSGNGDRVDIDDDPLAGTTNLEGSDLVLRDLGTSTEKIFKNVGEYYFNKYGNKLLLKINKGIKDTLRNNINTVLIYDLASHRQDTIAKCANDFRNLAISDDGEKAAFLAERDTNSKSLQKFYGLYLYRKGEDSASLLLDKKSPGMLVGYTISENGTVSFSRSGNRLFFGTAPIRKPKDTTLIDFELAKLDVWNYKDDYLQTQQLFRLGAELKRNYLACYDFSTRKMLQLGSKDLPTVTQTGHGDGDIFVAVTDTGRRLETQWTGRSKQDVYAIELRTGKNFLVKKNLEGVVYPSTTGRYILLYDNKQRNYIVWDGNRLKNISNHIPFALYNEENDVPDDPNPYGIMGWQQNDSAVYIYDRYDVWKADPFGKAEPQLITRGRAKKTSFRHIITDTDEDFINIHRPIYFRTFNHDNKKYGVVQYYSLEASREIFAPSDYSYQVFLKAKNSDTFIYTRENFIDPPDLFLFSINDHPINSSVVATASEKLTSINPQQSQYNWGKAELYHWKSFSGKSATGILYKPEDFNPSRKYPMIIYFYERLSDGLNTYVPPAPTPSRLNIPFFVSRGYLIFVPDIVYSKGHPGKDAYNYIVSGAQSLAQNKWVDAKNIGLQGQSWGGYQVAYLITATKMFKAAWAGAPVVNMFSAYGGIRWESGNNRQSQYEKGQSRIGATPWEKPELYIENSPLFHLKNISTPLVIMANDADGAVPWYQGIEFFTAMRRLGKKIWMLSYNGEAHNLVERRNRKDIQIREQQYFDWQLKGEKPAVWLTQGVPAVLKGQEWGLEVADVP